MLKARPSTLQSGGRSGAQALPGRAIPHGLGSIIHIVRYEKTISVHANPQSLGWIKSVYRNAIEYTSRTKDLRGLPLAGACFFAPLIIGLSVLLGSAPFSLTDEPLWAKVCVWLLGTIGACGVPFSLWLAASLLRMDLFQLSDQPVIFDRNHRLVHRISSKELGGAGRMWRQRHLELRTYDWDLLDAEHNAESVVTGATVTTNHFLMFAVRKSAIDPTIIDSFQIANPMSLSDGLVDAMWEHIRRFMEEDGPHLPTPNEPLADQERPPNWWQSLGATGVFGPGYVERWRHSTGFMLLMHAIFPLTVPVYLLWGTGNWLSFKTEIPVDWPDEVKAAVGPAVRRG